MGTSEVLVVKVGGGEVDSGQFLDSFTGIVAGIKNRIAIVHGGGKDITRLLEALGVESQFHQGLRITGDTAIEAVEMALSGLVNKRIVGRLVAGGVKAIGVSGRDLGLVKALKLEAEVDLGHVGEATGIDYSFLQKMLNYGWLPVISPVSQDSRGLVLNINADHVARAVAAGLKAAELIFVSNVPCIYDDVYELSTLKAGQAENLITSGVIDGGMIPKVRSGIRALEEGVGKVVICDIEGLARHIAGQPAGTVITK
ncbi:MAG TPA: acetylglutamate kinase [Candidatus Glassbacteria bacterium]|nr:acetylglutamate kinase [Candidatus Glassbacteria bacterium]